MKKCPNCQRIFDDSNDYCLDDGTPLIAISGQSSFDTPTQFIPTPLNSRDIARQGNTSPWPFLVIGVLVAALIGAGLFIYFRSSTSNEEPVAGNRANENGPGFTNAKTPEQKAAAPATVSPPALPASGVSPTGTWTGTWAGGSSQFTAAMSLTESNGTVSGRIVWTLVRTTNPKKIGKEGLSATEYVQGTYDASTRMLKMHGVRKDDPNGLVILDTYNLSVSEDGRTIGGQSRNGTVFKLQRN